MWFVESAGRPGRPRKALEKERGMRAIRFTIVIALNAFAITLAGCSNASSVVPGTGLQQRASQPSPPAKGVKITEFADLPQQSSGYYGPTAITSGPEKSLWATDVIDQDFGENVVVQIATSGKQVHAFYYSGLSTEGASFVDIAPGPDGMLWITDEYNGQILSMTTGGQYAGYLLNNFLAPLGIVTGPDRALWFAERGGSASQIGRITTHGEITNYPAAGGPTGIAAGPDKALWFTEFDASAIGRITTKGKVTTYSKGITPNSEPYSIAPGPDGALWFTEFAGGRIGRITTDGKVAEYSKGITPSEQPVGIAAGPDGSMWFTESETYDSNGFRLAKIGRITMSGKITEYSKGLTANSDPTDIVAGPDHNMWFVESAADRTGRVRI
jgi:virginiamycin B lyase